MNGAPVAPTARYVLCWLQQALRATGNPVIDASVLLGNSLGLPVLVYHGVREDYSYASDRLHAFILGASRDLERDCRARGLACAQFVDRPAHRERGLVYRLVAAASYEARVFGVRSALPSVTALRRCPDLVFVPPRFEVYRDVSRQIHEVFARYTDLVQPLSLDEAYLDVTADKQGLGTAWRTARDIRAAILQETGLTASAGISYNKFLAKLASDHRKPNGQFAVTPDMGAAWVETLPVSRFHGVGPVTAGKMGRLGIETGADLRAKPLEFLQRHFGSSAAWYHAIARGEDDRPVNPDRVRKSSGSETTFDRDLTEPGQIEAGVLRMADDVWRWCETGGRSAGR